MHTYKLYLLIELFLKSALSNFFTKLTITETTRVWTCKIWLDVEAYVQNMQQRRSAEVQQQRRADIASRASALWILTQTQWSTFQPPRITVTVKQHQPSWKHYIHNAGIMDRRVLTVTAVIISITVAASISSCAWCLVKHFRRKSLQINWDRDDQWITISRDISRTVLWVWGLSSWHRTKSLTASAFSSVQAQNDRK